MVSGAGSKQVIDYKPASRPAIDCFYVYPLVSLQTTPDTTLRIDPQETAIAELSMIAARQTRCSRHTRSPLARMIQSDAMLSRLTK